LPPFPPPFPTLAYTSHRTTAGLARGWPVGHAVSSGRRWLCTRAGAAPVGRWAWQATGRVGASAWHGRCRGRRRRGGAAKGGRRLGG
jgi:hypothetical protein